MRLYIQARTICKETNQWSWKMEDIAPKLKFNVVGDTPRLIEERLSLLVDYGHLKGKFTDDMTRLLEVEVPIRTTKEADTTALEE